MLNFDWLAGVSQESAKWVFLVLFVLIGILVLLVPNETVFEGVEEKDRHWYTNLKLWALTVLTVLFITYYAF